jgi:serine/threonine-protein kinase
MADVARRSPAFVGRRPAVQFGDDSLEDRAYLQERLTIFTKLMFASFVILLAFLALMYLVYPDASPPDNDMIFGGSAVALVVMALVWRLYLERRKPSVKQLYLLDMIYAVSIGNSFAWSAVLSYPLRPAAYASLVYGVCTVFTRAIIVPSSGRRTLATSIVTFTPMFIAACYLGARTKQELPGPAYVGGMLVLSAVAVALAATGSRVIYSLRKKVSESMQLGQYTVGELIGEGGMGAVYHAQHALLRRPTAIKLIREQLVGGKENLARFEREVQHMSQLTHANTVAVFDYGRTPDGLLYYAMEYLAGIDLAALVKRYGPQPPSRVVHVLVQATGALQEAHEQGLIHRDVKPANIILCERGGVPDVAKVVDFGLVKKIEPESHDTTQTVRIEGTPGYIAPELVMPGGKITASVDIYSLGAVGYFMLTGRHVFDGDNPIMVCAKSVSEPPAPIGRDDVPAPLEAIILKCLSKQPEARYESAAELALALEALPRGADWSRDDARAWWRTYRDALAATPASDAPTRTIQIVLGSR